MENTIISIIIFAKIQILIINAILLTSTFARKQIAQKIMATIDQKKLMMFRENESFVCEKRQK